MNDSTQYGIGLGSAVTAAISFETNHSVIWTIVHGFLSWFYVIYFAITR
jgi:hypothetical protein